MTQYKIKFFHQLTGECCKVLHCEKHILQEVKEEYSQLVEEVDLPNGDYFSRLYMICKQNGEENDELVKGSIEYPLKSKNHKTRIN